ncbi:hypothetical protein Cob_v013018 [Colletotrichum orbiculare MAFF 240422]|uniref:Uncharacterized protein n=1 Tax=Colletotrichum orbiculare (strain 104-T / ATCC 96160 / CBS 514.97 / LARS 414 / MAFF 240422) TaxID=1213857 RepID=A0A484F9E0_COLOR|nr:hypothetical protein Cob_v013018 [Colletotrichum orbiculare MAFF 240422]
MHQHTIEIPQSRPLHNLYETKRGTIITCFSPENDAHPEGVCDRISTAHLRCPVLPHTQRNPSPNMPMVLHTHPRLCRCSLDGFATSTAP